jgi:hypothetical protein
MTDFTARKLMFKAWNTETKLLMRLNSIDCNRGELVKKNHILLQFTGLHDEEGEEIYDMDVIMKGRNKFLIRWDSDRNGWVLLELPDKKNPQPLTKGAVENSKRLWSLFESERGS